jgi:tetratricopeptide (TPR) repeat protein
LELKPDHANTFYNLACFFSRRGKTDDALAYLEKAIEGDKKYREMAKTDEDFDNIRDDPRFEKLIGED